jgi:hypothetical protein
MRDESDFYVPEIWPIPPLTDAVVYRFGPEALLRSGPHPSRGGTEVWGCQVEDPEMRVSLDGRCPGCRIAAEARVRYWNGQ